MALYNFTLTLSGVTYETEGLEDALYESGCGDAIVCAYGNSVYVEFDREAESLDAAIASAVDNIESAGIGAIVESVDSALVGLSDVAEMTGMSRQAITMLKDGLRGGGDFPCPIQRIRDSPRCGIGLMWRTGLKPMDALKKTQSWHTMLAY